MDFKKCHEVSLKVFINFIRFLLCVRGTLCDVYKTCQESHFGSKLDNRQFISFFIFVVETNEAPSIPPDPKDLKCKHSNITNNKDLPGGIHKNNFTEVKEAKNMASCMKKCCDNKDCDLAYMVQKKCYAVSCTKKEYCIPMTVKASKKSPLMSAMIMKVESKVETGALVGIEILLK